MHSTHGYCTQPTISGKSEQSSDSGLQCIAMVRGRDWHRAGFQPLAGVRTRKIILQPLSFALTSCQIEGWKLMKKTQLLKLCIWTNTRDCGQKLVQQFVTNWSETIHDLPSHHPWRIQAGAQDVHLSYGLSGCSAEQRFPDNNCRCRALKLHNLTAFDILRERLRMLGLKQGLRICGSALRGCGSMVSRGSQG